MGRLEGRMPNHALLAYNLPAAGKLGESATLRTHNGRHFVPGLILQYAACFLLVDAAPLLEEEGGVRLQSMRHTLCIAVLAPGADLRASRHRVPG